MQNPDFRVWILLCVLVGILVTIYISLGLAASPGTLLMPLDDTYIHFQYARQMAAGEPYIYNPDDDPTSGGTSFLYPILLALGYKLGFTDLRLAYWAVLIGAICLLLSAWLIYRLIAHQQNRWLALLLTLAFLLTGVFVWSAMSGMETALFLFTVLLVLYMYQQAWMRGTLLAAILAALTRPEGGIIAVTVVAALLWHERQNRRYWLWLSLPAMAIAVQPIINFFVTGSFSAAGTEAKSHFSNLAVPFSERVEASLRFFWRIWRELLTGESADTTYLFPLVVFLALMMILISMRESWQKRRITPAFLAGSWIVLLSAAIATLDTAFWQFKRYQIPMMALMFPLAGWLLTLISTRNTAWRRIALFTAVALIVLTLPTSFIFARAYFSNIDVLRRQQVAMTEWIAVQHWPVDTRLGVHDVGFMRYIGDHPTYDVVGLTTPGNASSWRLGPGAIYERMEDHPQRPDYFAIYPNVAGLPYLWEAEVLGEELARFEVELPVNTVVSATPLQIISQPDWSEADEPDWMRQPSTDFYLYDSEYALRFEFLDTVDIANLDSEAAANYEWWNRETPGGYATEVRRLPYAACSYIESCTVTDGNRVLSGGERFTLPKEDYQYPQYRIVGRYHAAFPVTLHVGCEGEPAQYVIPEIPGHWVEVVFLVDGADTTFCIESTGGFYYPATYWIWGGGVFEQAKPDSIAEFQPPESPNQIELLNYQLEQEDKTLHIIVDWFSPGNLRQDGKIFVHLYDEARTQPVAQADTYPFDALPPANWLPGLMEYDEIDLSLDDVPPGIYTLVIGFYDPATGTRYAVSGQGADTVNRWVVLQSVQVE